MKSHDQVTLLYVAGFVSTVVAGTAMGVLSDVVGRKRMATIACALSVIGCLTKLASNMAILVLGKILGMVLFRSDQVEKNMSCESDSIRILEIGYRG